MRTFQRAFTLVEMMVVVAIIGVLAIAVTPVLQIQTQRAKEQDLRFALRELRSAIDAYRQAVTDGRIRISAGESGFPPSLEALVEGVEDAKSPKGARIRFLRRIPVDPMAALPVKTPSDSWLKRSYASPHDQPSEGADVFDVLSRSQAIGLNGIEYRQW